MARPNSRTAAAAQRKINEWFEDDSVLVIVYVADEGYRVKATVGLPDGTERVWRNWYDGAYMTAGDITASVITALKRILEPAQ